MIASLLGHGRLRIRLDFGSTAGSIYRVSPVNCRKLKAGRFELPSCFDLRYSVFRGVFFYSPRVGVDAKLGAVLRLSYTILNRICIDRLRWYSDPVS